MAAFDVLTLDSGLNRIKVPLAADTYNLPRSVAVTGTVTSTGDVVGSGVSLAQSAVHQADTTNPHSVTAQQLGAILTSTRNVANGVATTDANNEAVQLPAGAAAASFGDVLQQDGSWVHAPKSSLVATAIVSTGGTLNLTLAQAQGTVALDVTGALTANLDITIPAGFSKVLIVDNKTSGAFTLTVFTLGGAGIQIMQGSSQVVYSNGIDMEGVTAGGSGGVVTNVFGRVGNISATAGDYTASKITNVPAGGIAAIEVQSAINELDTEKLTVTHGADTANPHSVTKAQVGLGSVDNTSDVNKPVSTAQQTALNLKANLALVSNVNNTSDTNKPVSAAQQNALDLKANLGDVVNFSRVSIPKIDYILPIPAANIVDHDFFDNTQDAAWIDRCANNSWETEHIALGRQYLAASYANDAAALAANPSIVNGDVYYTGSVFNEYGVGVTTRSGSRKFPMRGFVTAEAARVIIWDITSGQPEMWMVFNVGSDYALGGAANISSVAIKNNLLCVGIVANGLQTVNFVSEKALSYVANLQWVHSDLVSQRNTTVGGYTISAVGIVNNTVNSVAITYLPDAPLDDYGMRVPTIAVGTAGGVSVIKHDGSVVSDTANPVGELYFSPTKPHYLMASVWYGASAYIAVTSDYMLSSGSGTDFLRLSTNPNGYYRYDSTNGVSGLPNNVVAASALRCATIGGAMFAMYERGSSTQALGLIYENPTTPANGMVAYLTNTYNTGWMVGDIRRAYLCNSLTADRSVKGGTLTVNGTITETVNAGGVNVYSGFSATNYFSEASHADWNALGTGDFSIVMSGVKWGTAGVDRALLMLGANNAVGSMLLSMSVSNTLSLWRNDGTGWFAMVNIADALTDTTHHSITFSRTNGVVSAYLDEVLKATASSSLTVSHTGGDLRIGHRADYSMPWIGGQVALVRISATAPTPEQIKHMYETERKLFEPNAQALLSNSASVSDLRYDKKSGMYAVTNGTNTDLFKDLVRVDSAATSATIATPVTTLSGNRVLAPAVDIGSELSTIKTVHNRRRVLLDFNVVVNGKFSRASGWTLGAGWSIANGTLTGAAASGLTTWSNILTVKNGISYIVAYTILNRTAGSVYMQLEGNVVGNLNSANGTYTETLTAAGTGFVYIGAASFTGSIDNLFIRESTDTLPQGFKPTKVWAGGALQEEGTDYDVTFDGFLYGVNFFIEPATNVQVEGEYI